MRIISQPCQGVARRVFSLPGNHLLRSVICLFVACKRGARRRNEQVRSEAGMAGEGKLKHHDGSEMNAMASVNASLSRLHDKCYPSLGLCIPQAILEENPVLHIRDCNKQHHVLLQRYACKHVCLEREASRLHNLWNSCSILPKYIKNHLKRSEIQKCSWGACPQIPLVGALHVLLEPLPANFCLFPCNTLCTTINFTNFIV